MKQILINATTEEVKFNTENKEKWFSIYEVSEEEYNTLTTAQMDAVSDLVVKITLNR